MQALTLTDRLPSAAVRCLPSVFLPVLPKPLAMPVLIFLALPVLIFLALPVLTFPALPVLTFLALLVLKPPVFSHPIPDPAAFRCPQRRFRLQAPVHRLPRYSYPPAPFPAPVLFGSPALLRARRHQNLQADQNHCQLARHPVTHRIPAVRIPIFRIQSLPSLTDPAQCLNPFLFLTLQDSQFRFPAAPVSFSELPALFWLLWPRSREATR